MLRLETYQRRENLVFEGFMESRYETSDDCYRTVLKTLAGIPGFENYAYEMQISRCHHLGPFIRGRTQGIICHFNW